MVRGVGYLKVEKEIEEQNFTEGVVCLKMYFKWDDIDLDLFNL